MLILLAASAVSGGEWHWAHQGHNEGADLRGVLTHAEAITATDCRPDQPLHVETGAPLLRTPCPACLHKLQTSGSEAPVQWTEAALQPHIVSAHDRAERAADRRHSPRSLRGPPVA